MKNRNGEKILLALDGSDRAFETIRYISELQPFRNKKVVLFSVMDRIPESYWDLERQPNLGRRIRDIRAWQESNRTRIQKYMEDAAQRLVKAGFPADAVKTKIQERKKGIARDIVEEAKRGYDAVALGRKGMSKVRGLVLGSVATKLLEKVAFVPLFVVGRCSKPVRILLGLDGSDASVRTVDYVCRTLEGCECDVTLAHVIRSEEPGSAEAAREKIGPVFDMAKSHLRNCGFDAKRIDAKIITGALSRAGALVQEARDGGYCTIIVGRKGMSKVRDFFMGRVSNKVVQLGRDKVVWVVS